MHQHGVGLRQDFHLAKRYFDSSAQTHPDARWPVNLALAGLYLHWWYSGEKGGITDKPILRTGSPEVLLDSVGVVAEARRVWGRWSARLGRLWDRLVPPLDEEEEAEEGVDGDVGEHEGVEWDWDWEAWAARLREQAPALDTALIGVLTVALLYVLRIRAEQREAARRRRQTGQATQQSMAAQAAVQQEQPPLREHQD